ncbi:RNA methyltransferase [Sinomonas notoginsengisoli]|uniref:TrmH family RNA methyltransferase n=1 Tax=Sinomonas notoginsengisoli TaxID=1457311 RepID=UPI001F39828B|nr:RNA methyltransferase [Sinomonas notoginsengisoli]
MGDAARQGPGQIIRLTSADDPRVADYTQLTDVHLRKMREPAEGLYIAESSRVLRRALAAGHRPRSFFLADKWLGGLADVLEAYPDVPVYIGAPELLEEITGFHLHRGAMAAMRRPEPVSLVELLTTLQERSRSRIAVLENLTDHTNVGAVFRSAAAIGVDAVLVTPQCADPLYRRSIRVSMGTVFQVPWTRIGSWPEDVALLKEAGYVVAGMTLGEGAITLDELVAEDHQNLALVFGTEGEGLAPESDRVLDRRVTIPMMNGVDSLNVAASSAVAFYATR